MMRSTIVLFVFCVCFKHLFAECPSGEYEPGPNCAFEEICGLPSAHTYRRHYCDCWCKPPLVRDSISHTCVETCPDYFNSDRILTSYTNEGKLSLAHDIARKSSIENTKEETDDTFVPFTMSEREALNMNKKIYKPKKKTYSNKKLALDIDE